ncbi:MAG: pseudaminic acid synthase [Polaribacter sp.]
MMTKEIKIGNRIISKDSPVFIIAELSCNHNGKLDIALQTIDEMHKAGADCVKLQTSKPGSITIDSNKESFIVKGGTLWDGKTLYELYQQTYTPWEWHKEIKDYVESKGMIFFSSPFDFEAVDFLEELDVPAYKIASFEITDIPLIEYTASKGKPVIISTGIASEEDIQLAVDTCRKAGNDEVILLKCTSAYPTLLDEVNLKMIPDIANKFNCLVGLSDHTKGSIVPIGSVALGGKIIEKHFILDRSLGGPDASFSMTPNEFKEMVDSVRDLEKTLGKVSYELTEKVKNNKQFARSLFVVKDVNEGSIISEENIKSIRPGNGLHPKYYKEILGKQFNQDVSRGEPLSLNMIK